MIRVLLVDDQELFRAGFRLLLAAHPDIDVVGEAADGEAAVRLTEQLRPDVVVMDIRMPVLDGIEATRLVTSQLPDTRVLVLTTFDSDRLVYDAITAGASGFLVKDASPGLLVESIRTLHAGSAVLAPAATRRLLEAFTTRPRSNGRTPPPFDALTDREQDVARQMARGRSNSEIAAELFLAETTVKTHVAAVLAKTGARDRIHIVVLAYETGWIQPGEPAHNRAQP